MFSRNSYIHNYNIRGRRNIHLNGINSKSGIRSFSYAAANFFNKLPSSVKNFKPIRSFTSNYWLEKNPMCGRLLRYFTFYSYVSISIYVFIRC